MKRILSILFLALLANVVFSQTKEIPFTLDDRDRIIRTEEKLNSMGSELNGKIESLNSDLNGKIESLNSDLNGKIESLRNEMNARFEAIEAKIEAGNSKTDTLFTWMTVIVSLLVLMFAYMVWDRRSALHPIQQKTIDHEERLRKLERISKEHAKKDPAFAELLRIAGLL